MPVSEYGKISTLEQEQRGGRYPPHNAVSLTRDWTFGVVVVKCFHCGQVWEHPAGARSAPEECKRK